KGAKSLHWRSRPGSCGNPPARPGCTGGQIFSIGWIVSVIETAVVDVGRVCSVAFSPACRMGSRPATGSILANWIGTECGSIQVKGDCVSLQWRRTCAHLD